MDNPCECCGRPAETVTAAEDVYLCNACAAELTRLPFATEDEWRAVWALIRAARVGPGPRPHALLAYGDTFAEIGGRLGVPIAGLAPEEAGPRLIEAVDLLVAGKKDLILRFASANRRIEDLANELTSAHRALDAANTRFGEG